MGKQLVLSCKCTEPLALHHLFLYGQQCLVISSLRLASVRVAYLNGPPKDNRSLKDEYSSYLDPLEFSLQVSPELLPDRESVHHRSPAAFSWAEWLAPIAPTVEVLIVRHGVPVQEVDAEWSSLRSLGIVVEREERFEVDLKAEKRRDDVAEGYKSLSVEFFLRQRHRLRSLALTYTDKEQLEDLDSPLRRPFTALTSLSLKLRICVDKSDRFEDDPYKDYKDEGDEEDEESWTHSFDCPALQRLKLGRGKWSLQEGWAERFKSLRSLTLKHMDWSYVDMKYLGVVTPRLTEFVLYHSWDLDPRTSGLSGGGTFTFNLSNAQTVRFYFPHSSLTLSLTLSRSLKAFSAMAKQLVLSCKSTEPLALQHLFLENVHRRSSAAFSWAEWLCNIAPTVEVLIVRHGMPVEGVDAPWSSLRSLGIVVESEERFEVDLKVEKRRDDGEREVTVEDFQERNQRVIVLRQRIRLRPLSIHSPIYSPGSLLALLPPVSACARSCPLTTDAMGGPADGLGLGAEVNGGAESVADLLALPPDAVPRSDLFFRLARAHFRAAVSASAGGSPNPADPASSPAGGANDASGGGDVNDNSSDEALALDVVRNAIQPSERPDHVPSLILASVICARRDTWSEEGVRYGERAVELAASSGPQRAKALHALGVNLLLHSRSHDISATRRELSLKRAVESLTQASEDDATSAAVMVDLALALAEERHVSEALKVAKRALKAGGGQWLLTWQLLALLLTCQQRFKDAEDMCRVGEAAMKKAGGAGGAGGGGADGGEKGEGARAALLVLHAKVHLASVGEAVESLKQAMAAVQSRQKRGDMGGSVTEAVVWQGLAEAYLAGGRAADADLCVAKCHTLDPYSADTWMVAGMLEEARGCPEEALACYRSALAIDQWHAASKARLGALLLRMGGEWLHIAQVYLREVVSGDGFDARAWHVLGLVERGRGDVGAAAECFRRAMEAEETAPAVPFNTLRPILPQLLLAIPPHVAAAFPARRASASPRAQSSADAATRSTGAHAPSSATESRESAEASAREAAALEAAAARVITLSSREEYDRLMADAKNKGRLAVVEVTMSTLPNTDRIYHTLVETARLFPNAVFLRIFADKSAELRGLAQSMQCARVPSYVLFREGQRVHEDAGMDAERLRAELLYYSAEGPVLEVHSAEEYRALIETHKDTDMLVVIEATLTFCGPCVRIHQTVLNLSHRMAGHAVFARFFGDSADCTRDLIRDLGVVEAPTFLFYRRGELLGRYVGSGRGIWWGRF
ncbi:unnamed protein product [Closterium sp. Yama58-4]|nr:unnamed protein product [Closterium sp. Yama58-4]